MTNENPTSGADTGLPKKTLSDCAHDAVMLSSLCEAVDELEALAGAQGQPGPAANGLSALVPVLVQKSKELARNLDNVQREAKQ